MVLLAALALAWWWYLRADPMEPPTLPGSVQTGTLEHGGHQRSWLAYVPAAKSPSPALVLVMHGSMGDGKQMREAARYGFDVLAERYGFIAVYPDGYERHWNDCRGGADYAANLENIDDVGFLRALVARMVDEQGVDPARIFATGLSNGGQMAYRLGLEAPDLVAGIAAMAASLPDPIACEPAGEAVAALVMNGTEDPVNPYEGARWRFSAIPVAAVCCLLPPLPATGPGWPGMMGRVSVAAGPGLIPTMPPRWRALTGRDRAGRLSA